MLTNQVQTGETGIKTLCIPRHSISKNKSEVVGLHPTTKSNLRTALGVEICKLCIIARICKPLSGKFSDLCSEMGICSDMM